MNLEKEAEEEEPKEETKKAEFDPDYFSSNPQNKRAAADYGLTYDPRAKVYRDRDGFAIRDEFGQPL